MYVLLSVVIVTHKCPVRTKPLGQWVLLPCMVAAKYVIESSVGAKYSNIFRYSNICLRILDIRIRILEIGLFEYIHLRIPSQIVFASEYWYLNMIIRNLTFRIFSYLYLVKSLWLHLTFKHCLPKTKYFYWLVLFLYNFGVNRSFPIQIFQTGIESKYLYLMPLSTMVVVFFSWDLYSLSQ